MARVLSSKQVRESESLAYSSTAHHSWFKSSDGKLEITRLTQIYTSNFELVLWWTAFQESRSLRTGTECESHLCKKDSMPAKCLHNKLRKLYYRRRKQSSLGTGGERAANRLKNNALETVCKETSVSREVFQDPGFMTGTRDFKATRGQISKSKVNAWEAGAENIPSSETKKQLWGDVKDFENFPTEVKKILRRKAQWPVLLS